MTVNTYITIIRLLLWTALQSDPKIVVDKRFWIYPERTVVRSDFLPFIKACQTLGEELYDLVHNNPFFINVKQKLCLTSSTMHQALFQSLLYTKVSEINDRLSNTYDAVSYLSDILTATDCIDSQITHQQWIKKITDYFDMIRDSDVLDINSDDVIKYIQSN